MSILKKFLSVFQPYSKPPTYVIPEDVPIEGIDATPDKPIPFITDNGTWIAIKTEETQAVIDALGLSIVQPANWGSSVPIAYSDECLFITPPLHGWTIVACRGMVCPGGTGKEGGFVQTYAQLIRQFVEVQFFFMDDTTGEVAWAMAKGGEFVRIFSATINFVAESYLFIIDHFGPLTPIEHEIFAPLSLDDLSANEVTELIKRYNEDQDDWDNCLIVHRQDETLCRLAGAWSIDPLMLDEEDLPKSTGYIARLPSRYAFR